MTIYRSFIDGQWLETVPIETVPNINPANTEDIIGTAHLATREEARLAVEAAYNAFKSWKNTPAPARGRIIAKAARLIEENKEELAQLLTHEELKRFPNRAVNCRGRSTSPNFARVNRGG